jgi:hypothetical protein
MKPVLVEDAPAGANYLAHMWLEIPDHRADKPGESVGAALASAGWQVTRRALSGTRGRLSSAGVDARQPAGHLRAVGRARLVEAAAAGREDGRQSHADSSCIGHRAATRARSGLGASTAAVRATCVTQATAQRAVCAFLPLRRGAFITATEHGQVRINEITEIPFSIESYVLSQRACPVFNLCRSADTSSACRTPRTTAARLSTP